MTLNHKVESAICEAGIAYGLSAEEARREAIKEARNSNYSAPGRDSPKVPVEEMERILRCAGTNAVRRQYFQEFRSFINNRRGFFPNQEVD